MKLSLVTSNSVRRSSSAKFSCALPAALHETTDLTEAGSPLGKLGSPLRFLPAVLMAFCAIAPVLNAQISIPNTSAVTENFASLGATATAALPANWKMSAAGAGLTAGWSTAANVTAVTQGVNTGSPTTGGRYNWGNGTTTTDRAVGFMTSGGYASPNSVMAFYQNSTGSTITALAIAFDIERYRINTVAANVTFFTSTDGTTWTAQIAGDSGAFSTGTSAYNFTTGTVVNKSFSVAGLTIGAGAPIYLRWTFDTTGGNSQGLGLDNVSVTATTNGIPSPVISSFSPLTGWVGTSVVITGTGLADITAVNFNGVAAASFTINSGTQVTAVAPSPVTTGKITVTSGNGTGTSSADFAAFDPATLTLTATPTTFAENAVNPAAVGTVTRFGDTAAAPALEVTLTSSDPSRATVPATVTIPAGAASATFNITAVPDGLVTANSTVTITALANAFSATTNVTVTNVDLAPLTVVINKTFNTGVQNNLGDRVELLVVGNQTPGSTVDMRGMTLKDYSNSGADDAGGAYQFANTTFWSAIPVGTLIVVVVGENTSADTVASDFVLTLGASDTTYFTLPTGFGMGLGLSDLVMIKAAGFPSAGNVGAMHAFAIGTGNLSTFFTSFNGSKLSTTTTTGTDKAAIANNSNSVLTDYNGTGATGNVDLTAVTFGAANNPTNATYINSLRGGLSSGYAVWINSFFSGVTDPLIIGFNADPDKDGIPSGVEALIGGNPSVSGVFATTELVKTGNVFTFLYPKSKSVPSGITASYQWSSDLVNWQASGTPFGEVTVTLAEAEFDDSLPAVSIYQVTATATVGTPPRLFVRVLAIK